MTTAIERIEARQAIADLVHTYALAIRRGDPARAAALFTDDGVFEVREGDPRDPARTTLRSRSEGRDAIAAYVSGAGRPTRNLPMIHNLLIELDGDTATASSLMVARVWPDGPETIGDYADAFRKQDGRWLFTARTYTLYRVQGA